MAEPFTIYKLTILYMLSKAGFPLSNTQISNFFLEQEYTDYFRVQEVIGDLVDANLIHAESTHSNTQYSLTSAGKETLGFFKDKLNDGIENDVQGFFEKNKLEFRQENSILADYYKTTNQKYAVRCQSPCIYPDKLIYLLSFCKCFCIIRKFLFRRKYTHRFLKHGDFPDRTVLLL